MIPHIIRATGQAAAQVALRTRLPLAAVAPAFQSRSLTFQAPRRDIKFILHEV